jgi:predicted transcriptional regulator
MKNTIRAMAEHLADQVVKLIGTMTLGQLSALSSDGRAAKPAAKAATKAKSATKAKPAAKAATKAARRERLERDTKAKAKSATKAKPAYAKPAEASAAVLAVLTKSGEFMKAGAIIDALEYKPTTELLGRVLRDLVARGFVFKQGNTRNSEYQITASGIEQSKQQQAEE